jgi:chromosome segregation ATPase
MEQTEVIGAGLTFEKVWAAMQESSRRMEAASERVWEQIRETERQRKETERQIKESQEKTDRQIAETARQMKESREETERQIRKSREEAERQRKEAECQRKETERQIKESQEKTDRQIAKTARQIEETDRQMKETDRQLNKRFGELTNRFGDMVEYMVLPNLLTKFEELDFTFTKANRTEIKDKEHNIFTEVDALLENGDKVMAVEIKTRPNIDDINDHVERMEKLRKYADLHDDKRAYLGAVAGVVFSGSEKIYALKKGFYVIEPSGDTFSIIEPTGDYHPHEW